MAYPKWEGRSWNQVTPVVRREKWLCASFEIRLQYCYGAALLESRAPGAFSDFVLGNGRWPKGSGALPGLPVATGSRSCVERFGSGAGGAGAVG